MKIKTRLILAAFTPVLMACMIAIILVLSNNRMQDIQAQGKIAQQIINSVNELTSLARFYILYHEERPKAQFLSEYELTAKLIASVRTMGNRKQLTDHITRNNTLLKTLFLKLVSNYEDLATAENAVIWAEAEERLEGRFFIKSHAVISDALQFASLIDQEITATQNKINGLILLLMIATAIPLTFILIRMMGKITTSLKILTNGVEEIGKGKLDYRIDIPADDEIALLAQSIDRMTEQLQAVTVSKNILQQEMDERQKAEEALRESEEKFRGLFNWMGEAIQLCELIWDDAGKPIDAFILDVNPAYEKVSGSRREQVVGRRVTEVVPVVEQVWLNRYAELVLTGKLIHLEEYDSARDLWYELYASPIKGNQFAVVFSNITERKKAEEVLRRDKEMLEKLVADKAGKLVIAQQKLIEAKRLADIGTFSATVAHELRNPLAAISVAAYKIKKKMQNIKLEESFNTIDKKISESNQIINNILAYSKIQVSHFETVRINNILRTCINEAKERFPNRPISIDEKLDFTDNLTIEADPLQIKQVFNNILNNSFDAINMLPGLIEISSEVKNSRVLILIKDNGEGIAKEDLGKVINPFFTTKAKGTGLGLTVCHQILSMHFGSLAIESDKGTGTVVTIALPVHRQDDE